jgi:hypothetical protein
MPGRVEYTLPDEPTQTELFPVITGTGEGSTVSVKSCGRLVQPFRLDMMWYTTVPGLLLVRFSKSVIVLMPFWPGGHETMLAEQVGDGLVQLNVVLGGTDVRVIFVVTPAQIEFGVGGFTTGTGFIVTAIEVVGPGARQLEFVP